MPYHIKFNLHAACIIEAYSCMKKTHTQTKTIHHQMDLFYNLFKACAIFFCTREVFIDIWANASINRRYRAVQSLCSDAWFFCSSFIYLFFQCACVRIIIIFIRKSIIIHFECCESMRRSAYTCNWCCYALFSDQRAKTYCCRTIIPITP